MSDAKDCRDDFVELHLNARAFSDPEDAHIRGRLISSGKSSLEILTEEGRCVFISREVIVKMELIAHTRPAYIDDKELLAFEREDMKRRSKTTKRSKKRPKETTTRAPLGMMAWTPHRVGPKLKAASRGIYLRRLRHCKDAH